MASQGRHTVMSPYQILPSSWKNPIRINRFKWHANICDALITGGSEEVTLTIVQMVRRINCALCDAKFPDMCDFENVRGSG